MANVKTMPIKNSPSNLRSAEDQAVASGTAIIETIENK